MKPDWLLAVGCSLTWGTEITYKSESVEEDKLKAWPAELGKLLDCDKIINRGWPGRSNASIFRIAMQDLAKYNKQFSNNGLLVVQWSGLHRIELIDKDQRVNFHKFYLKNYGQAFHPGHDFPYINFTVNEVLDKDFQNLFPGAKEFLTNNWLWDFYQSELLLNNIVSLTAVAKQLGIKILHFNGIDAIEKDWLPDDSRYLLDYIGSEFYSPFEREKSFWIYSYKSDPKLNNSKIPPHPTAEHHAEWAKLLRDYLLTVYPV